MERPFQERDVAQYFGEQCRSGIALHPAAMAGQHDEGKVRPRRLRFDPAVERSRIGGAHGFLGEDRHVRAIPDPLHQVRQVDAYLAEQAGFQQDAPGDRRIATARRQDQGTLRSRRRRAQVVLAIRGEAPPT